MKKWTAKELFDTFKSEMNLEEVKELYKALLAREIGLDEYTDEADKLMTEMLEDKYYRNNNIGSFINDELVDMIHDEFVKSEFEVDDTWF